MFRPRDSSVEMPAKVKSQKQQRLHQYRSMQPVLATTDIPGTKWMPATMKTPSTEGLFAKVGKPVTAKTMGGTQVHQEQLREHRQQLGRQPHQRLQNKHN